MIDWSEYRNFSRREFVCGCGCGRADMQPDILDLLQAVRDEVGFPVVVGSGFRCPEHNLQVSTTGPHGPHTTGLAADIAVSGSRAFEVARVAMADDRLSGLGVQQKGEGRFIHLDAMPPGMKRPRIWSY